MPMATPAHTQQTLRHRLTWPQPHTQGRITPSHTRPTPRPSPAVPHISQLWTPLQFTPETWLWGQVAKAASQSVARDLQSPRVHRLGQTAMVTIQPMHLSQGMGTTQYMGTMLTMRLGLCMARPRSRLCTGRQSRMTRVLA